jgi:hypothetical protein
MEGDLRATITKTDVQFPSNNVVSKSTQNIIKRMLERDPAKRIDWPTLFSL